MSEENIEIQLAKLQTQFEEHRKQTEATLASISADVRQLVEEKNQRIGSDRSKKAVLAFLLVAIPTAVSAAISYLSRP